MAGATRKATAEFEELIDRKLSTLASKESIEDLKKLIIQQNGEINELREKVSRQEEVISHLNDRYDIVSSAIRILKKQADHQELYSRRYCLRIKGIKKDANETPES